MSHVIVKSNPRSLGCTRKLLTAGQSVFLSASRLIRFLSVAILCLKKIQRCSYFIKRNAQLRDCLPYLHRCIRPQKRHLSVLILNNSCYLRKADKYLAVEEMRKPRSTIKSLFVSISTRHSRVLTWDLMLLCRAKKNVKHKIFHETNNRQNGNMLIWPEHKLT